MGQRGRRTGARAGGPADVPGDALTGIMSQVDADGYLNGESLPSVFARAFWLLYRQTGDRAEAAGRLPGDETAPALAGRQPPLDLPEPDQAGPRSPAPTRIRSTSSTRSRTWGTPLKIAQALGMPDEAAELATRASSGQALGRLPALVLATAGRPGIPHLPDRDASGRSEQSVEPARAGTRPAPASLRRIESALLALYGNTHNVGLPFLVPGRTRYGDLRPITLGLFAGGRSDDAAQLTDACLRDVTRAGRVLRELRPRVSHRTAQGVRPSAFGACLMANSVLWHNGVTLDEGLPVLLGMPGAVGVDSVPVQRAGPQHPLQRGGAHGHAQRPGAGPPAPAGRLPGRHGDAG